MTRLDLRRMGAALALAAAPLAAGAQPPTAAHVLDNGRVHVVFADPATGLSTTNPDRVDSISWIASDGTATGNLAANGGPLHCNDPQEYFGQAYGEATSARPFLVIAGDTARWKGKASNTHSGKTTTDPSKPCDTALDGGASTRYAVSTKAAQINQLSVARSFTFATVNTAGNLRAYVPRLPIAGFATVYWPNAAGVEQTGNAGGCPGVCEVTDWNGVWFAEQNAAGVGLLVIRNPAVGLPAVIAFDNDSFSGSNNSAVVLKMPAGGWTGVVSETEHLCFYDATSWPTARRAAGMLPSGCTRP